MGTSVFLVGILSVLCGAFGRAPYEGCAGYGAVHHFKVGLFRGTVLSDGDLVMKDNPFDTPLVAVHRSYRNLSLSLEPYRFAQNTVLLRYGRDVILVDTGLGSYTGHGTRAGMVVKNMALIGLKPSDVTMILITHGHFDHVGGLVTKDDKQVFPNAVIYMSRREHDWWLKEAKVLKDVFLKTVPTSKQSVPAIKAVARVGAETPVTETLLREFKRSLAPYPTSRIKLVEAEDIPIEGISFKATLGHTPGHFSVIVRSYGDTLFIAGDMVLGEASNLVHPEWAMNIEQDKSEAIATRFKILDLLAETGTRALLYHEAFPGLGYVSKSGSTTFKWTPTDDTKAIVERCRGYQLAARRQ